MDYEKIALEYHSREPKGKIATVLTKPIDSQDHLSIAYSPGVAGPCREIAKNPEAAFEYTGRANLIGVISNGTAVLGLGDIGAQAAKPVMEGKAMLFKKLANIDVFDIEIDEKNADKFIQCVKALEPTFGGINLEDIKAPECFYIEETLQKQMNIPVFHDDQHGTAITASAAFLNALEITHRKIEDCKVVFSGAGAAAIACAKLFIQLGVKAENLLMCDSHGVLNTKRGSQNPYKDQFIRDTTKETLAEALVGADAFVGVSAADILTPEMLKTLNEHPIIFALANPNPEINPDLALKARPDAIIATGRSDYPNQVNNVLGFPFIFRGALDVSAREINLEMKLAAVRAIADLAKQEVPDAVIRAYPNALSYRFGKDYLIPKPVDPRVLMKVAPAVAQAAMDSGVARKNIDIEAYKDHIEKILGPSKRIIRKMRHIISKKSQLCKKKPRILLTHGHDNRLIRAAAELHYEGDIEVVLLGSRGNILYKADQLGLPNFENKVEIINPIKDSRVEEFADQYFNLRKRKGVDRSLAKERMRNLNYFGSMLLKNGYVDGMLNGLVEPYSTSVKPLIEVFGSGKQETLVGVQMLMWEQKIYFLADSTMHIEPSAEQLAEIAEQTAVFAQTMLDEPVRLALLSYSNFGSNPQIQAQTVQKAADILHRKACDFIFDGDIQADMALNPKLQQQEFPFCRLNGSANVLIFPNLMAANISYKTLQQIAGASCIGPILIGSDAAIHVLERGASTDDICKMAYITAQQSYLHKEKNS